MQSKTFYLSPASSRVSCITLNLLTIIHFPGDLQGPGPRSQGRRPFDEGGLAVSQVMGLEAGPVLGAPRGQAHHALRPLVTWRLTEVVTRLEAKIKSKKSISRSKPCITQSGYKTRCHAESSDVTSSLLLDTPEVLAPLSSL